MKRLLSVLFVAMLLVTTCACEQVQDQTNPSFTQPITPIIPGGVNTEIPPVAQQPMFAASMPYIVQDYTAEDGSVVLQHITQNLELIVPDPEIADTVIIDYLNRTDPERNDFQGLLNEAQNAYTSDALPSPYLLQNTFVPQRIDQGVFSLLGQAVVYKGNSHPEVSLESVSYDLATGKVLLFSDILHKDADVTTLLEYVLDTLKAQEDDLVLYEGYADTVKNAFHAPENWYFSQKGLVFYYSPYEIAPYASGTVRAEIAYNKLPGILNDAYFPAETDGASGQLLVSSMNIDQLENCTQIAEIVCTENGVRAVISTDGLLHDIWIERIDEAANTIIFRCATLSPGDGIIIHATEKDSFKIHYTVGGTQCTKNLSFSDSGTPQITE